MSSMRNGGQLVAAVLKAHEVQFVFTLAGGHISPILVESQNAGIRIIDVRHEVNAVFAADAVGRLTGTAGVAAVTAGPGVTNTITAIKNAQMAQSPVVLIGGAAATMIKGRGSLQDIDQLAVLKPIVKFAASVSTVRDIVPTLRRAMNEAVSGVPGPVFVEFPLDVLYPAAEIASGMGMAVRRRARDITTDEERAAVIVPTEFGSKSIGGKPGRGGAGNPARAAEYVRSLSPNAPVFLDRDRAGQASPNPWVVDKFLGWKLANLFTDGWDAREFGPLPRSLPMPASGDIAKAVALLRSAQRPVLVLGSQSTLQPAKLEVLAAAVEAAGAPCFLGGMARGLLGNRSRCHVRQNRGVALRKADVVVLAGVVCDFRMNYGRDLSRKSTVISVNRDRDSLTLNSDAFWSPALASLADPCEFLLAVLAGVGDSRAESLAPWLEEYKSREAAKEAANVSKAREPAMGRLSRDGESLLNPLSLCFDMESVLGPESVLVADGGDFVATASYIVRPRGPLRWLDPGAFGTLGVGAGFALGAKLVRPESEVWLIWGDGSCGYSVAEFDTFSRHNVPVIALVGNDACWTQIEREQLPILGADTACPLEYCAYDEVAAGYGGLGLKIESPSEDVAGTLRRAQAIARGEGGLPGRPVLVNAHIGQTNFREGSLSV